MGFPLSFSHKVSSTTKRSITSTLVAVSFLSWGAATVKATGSDEIQFRKQTIDLGRSETVTVADINHDGRLDIVSGENWFEQTPRAPGSEGPRWIKHHFRDLAFTDGYIEDLSDLAIDVDGDGYPDIVSCNYWEEPISPGGRIPVLSTGPGKSRSFRPDLRSNLCSSSTSPTRGRSQQLLPQFGDEKFPMSWYELVGKGNDARWVRHIVDEKSYGHGIGLGDLNKDGRNDILTPKGGLRRLLIHEMESGLFTLSST